MDETAGAANAHLGARISRCLVLFTSRKMCKWSLLRLLSSGKFRFGVSLFNATAKRVCNAMFFPGNYDPLSLTPGGPVVPLVCGIMRLDNLVAWCELLA